ncbi:hypothetical protein EKG37_20715 [Robertmurraya yapensis]|uniref:DUF5668 domain-containing protein n=2 Tax=Bacillaceae TaxID=186817 RepID=A0A3S0REW2_9BACI|nr:hypothetical protein [Bacillus yapensis]RTR26732.1 hypothetical protein EKG37_20715 [Bacillus yapensis]TKS93820.1 hypothetical protein FAR12_20720 [Bacillus yapensis]
MRTWRVGTVSMGISLLLLGIFLLLSEFIGLSLSNILMSWWPIILVVLGAEILLYLFFSRSEKPLLKYDFLSIIFVGVLGMVGIGFAIMSSMGLNDLVTEAIAQEEQTIELPELAHVLKEDIHRVVVDTADYPFQVETTSSSEVSMFGTYRASVQKGQSLVKSVEDYVSVHQKGDTLFLQVKKLPTDFSPFSYDYAEIDATLLVPENVKLEIVGHSNLTLKPRAQKSNWHIENASNVELMLGKNSDVTVHAKNVDELVNDHGQWESDGVSEQNGMFKIGSGTHSIDIVNVFHVDVSLLNE